MGLYDCICIYVFAWSNHLFKSMNLKNFSAMKTWQKVALGTLGLVVANNLLQERPQKERCIRVRNKDLWYPPNNGGL